jgi:amino acid transporter
MARDNNLPWGRTLARVRADGEVPVLPTVTVGVLAAGILVAFANNAKLYETVGAVAIAWANLAYLLVTLPLLVRRLRGKWREPAGPHFGLGRWGTVVNLVAVVWSVALITNLVWPRAAVYGTGPVERWAGVGGMLALVAIGGAYYLLVQRHRTGVLEEHRAEGAISAAPAAAAD